LLVIFLQPFSVKKLCRPLSRIGQNRCISLPAKEPPISPRAYTGFPLLRFLPPFSLVCDRAISHADITFFIALGFPYVCKLPFSLKDWATPPPESPPRGLSLLPEKPDSPPRVYFQHFSPGLLGSLFSKKGEPRQRQRSQEGTPPLMRIFSDPSHLSPSLPAETSC